MKAEQKRSFANYVPILSWMKDYKKEWVKGDLNAGLTVGVMLIPQGMAYSMLAGLPPIYGLYASIIPLILYAIFGTSRQLAVGPVAMVALLISSGVGSLVAPGSEEFIQLAIMSALMVGVLQLTLGLLRLGFIVNFLSHPVISGFTSAAALIIGLSQLKHLTGLDIPRGKVHEILGNFFSNISETHIITALIGVGAIVTLKLVKKFIPKVPGPLVVVVISTVLVGVMGLDASGVKIVADVPSGLPSPSLSFLNFHSIKELLPIVVTISLVGFMESIAVAKAIQAKHKDYEVDANQELIGLGAANIGGSLFQAFPTTGGFSRTAVNDQAGAKSGLASIISAALIAITLLFLTDYFYFMPKAVLASIIMVAVFGLIDYKEAIHLWKHDKADFFMLITTFVFTLALGIEEGILIGVVLSLIVVIKRAAYPHVAFLGKLPNKDIYKNVERYDVENDPSRVIVRLDAPLWFANSKGFKDKVEGKLKEKEGVKELVFDFSSVNHIDSTGVHMLEELHADMKDKEVRLAFCGLIGPVRDIFKKNHLYEKFGDDSFHYKVSEVTA